jgi:hypothetical protein
MTRSTEDGHIRTQKERERKRHSLPVKHGRKDESGQKKSEKTSLTSCQAKRAKQVRAQKESEKVKGTHALSDRNGESNENPKIKRVS